MAIVLTPELQAAVAPVTLARFRIETHQKSIIQSVDVSLVKHGTGELAAHGQLGPPEGINGPLAARLGHLEHGTADAVTGGDEHPVAVQDQRRSLVIA